MEKIPVKEISDAFSRGEFKSVFEHFDEHISWNIVGSPAIISRGSVIAHCNKMLSEMASSTMNNTNFIVSNDTVVVQGYCSYTNQDNSPGRVEYCDIFRFGNNKLQEITSYIIEVES